MHNVPDGYHDIEIGNLALISACWGPLVADQVVDRVQAFLTPFGSVSQDPDRPGLFRVPPGEEWERLLPDLLYRLSARPIPVTRDGQEAVVHAVLTWRGDNRPRYRLARDIHHDHGAHWPIQYENDMRIAAQVFACLSEGRVAMHWQGVCDYREPDRVLYHEGLVRLGGPIHPLSPSVIFPALARTGLASSFDRLIVDLVLEHLRADPLATLGVNISATSAHLHGWWGNVLADLAEDPQLAQRLVVEITESEQIADIGRTVAFAQRLRSLGVTLALDDFGVGYTSIRQLMEVVPALVKIDGLFLRRAARSENPCHSLPYLIGLIRELGGTVIVEGVETQGMADIAFFSGATWHQGYHYGRPAPDRSGVPHRLQGDGPSTNKHG